MVAARGTDAPPGSIGIPVPGLELRLVDSEGHDVLVGDAGEVWWGPGVFAGLGRPGGDRGGAHRGRLAAHR